MIQELFPTTNLKMGERSKERLSTIEVFSLNSGDNVFEKHFFSPQSLLVTNFRVIIMS